MNFRRIFALTAFLVATLAIVKADEHDESSEMSTENQYDETPAETKSKTLSDKAPKMIEEDMKTETSALVQSDYSDPDAIKNKGRCHYGVATWYKPGFNIRCNCLKCTCRPGGKWDCNYHFAFCPYYYCGNQIYNPYKQLCCCGKVYTKKASYSCCGYFYYYTKTSKCCNYYSVKPKKANCPRYRI